MPAPVIHVHHPEPTLRCHCCNLSLLTAGPAGTGCDVTTRHAPVICCDAKRNQPTLIDFSSIVVCLNAHVFSEKENFVNLSLSFSLIHRRSVFLESSLLVQRVTVCTWAAPFDVATWRVRCSIMRVENGGRWGGRREGIADGRCLVQESDRGRQMACKTSQSSATQHAGGEGRRADAATRERTSLEEETSLVPTLFTKDVNALR